MIDNDIYIYITNLINKFLTRIYIFYILLFVLFAFTLSKTLKKKKNTLPLEEIVILSYCCEDYKCKDYRCSLKKCDWFHWCKKGYRCLSHRSVKK